MNHKNMLNLKVGDKICDCRFIHQKITKIEEDKGPHRSSLRFFRWVPFPVYDWIYDIWPTETVDKTLTLEDSSMCSAIHCANILPCPGHGGDLNES